MFGVAPSSIVWVLSTSGPCAGGSELSMAIAVFKSLGAVEGTLG